MELQAGRLPLLLTPHRVKFAPNAFKADGTLTHPLPPPPPPPIPRPILVPPPPPPDSSTSVGEMWSGTLQLSLGLVDLSTPAHIIQVAAYSEKCELKRAYCRLLAPAAKDLGPYSEDTASQLAGVDVLFAGFHCEPFINCGLQRRAADPRAESVMQTAHAQRLVHPHLAVWENVVEFFNDVHLHGMLTKATEHLRPSMHLYPVLFLYDSQLGGPLCRPRGFAFWECLDAFNRPWSLKPPLQSASPPSRWMLHPSEVCSSLYVEGTVVLKHNRNSSATDTPRVVGHVHFPLAGSPPVIGAAYQLRGGVSLRASHHQAGAG